MAALESKRIVCVSRQSTGCVNRLAVRLGNMRHVVLGRVVLPKRAYRAAAADAGAGLGLMAVVELNWEVEAR